MSVLGAQVSAEVSLVRRNGEQLLVTLGIPLLLLVFFGSVDILPSGDQSSIDFLVPGILSLAVMSTAMVSLGIGTGFERSYLVLKRLAATPLGTGRLIAAKTVAVVCVEAVQMVLIVAVGFALDWSPQSPNWLLGVLAVILGTFAFAGIGLLLAGTLRGEVNLAASNGLYLALLLSGGLLFPLDRLPGPLQGLGRALPAHALSNVLRDALASAGEHTGSSWVVLCVWAVIAPACAARFFRWK